MNKVVLLSNLGWALQAEQTSMMSYLIIVVVALLMFGLGAWLRPLLEQRLAASATSTIEPVDESAIEDEPDVEIEYLAFEDQYRQEIIPQTEHISFWHATDQQQVTTLREEFFVSPDFHLVDDDSQRLHLRDLLKNFRHVALLANSGAGKTETIYYLLLTYARQKANSRLSLRDDVIPVLLSAPDLAITLGTFAEMSLQFYLQQRLSEAPSEYVETRLSEGRFLILLDSLNELYVSDAERVIQWVNDQIPQYSNNRFVVVARPALQKIISQKPALTMVHFAPFETDSLEQLAKKWEGIIPSASETLAKVLQNNEAYSLARLPFHMVMMMMVANSLKSLPTKRVNLYPTYLTTQLSFGDEWIASHFSETEKRTLLQSLAFTMHQQHQTYMERSSLGRVLRGVLRTTEGNAELFVELCLENGLLVQKGDGCRFNQLNLQEFLVAREIVENNLHGLLTKQTNDLWWHEVISFFAELTNTNTVIDRIFSQETKELTATKAEQAKSLDMLNEVLDPIEGTTVDTVSSAAAASLSLEDVSAQPETETESEKSEPEEPEEPEEEKHTILVVDDTPQNLKFARFILQRGNYNVEEANDAAEALVWLENNRPTLILSDIQMPDMNGYEFCQHLKADDRMKDIPFMFVTAFSRASKEIVKGLKMGADDYVPRPFAPEELLARIGANVRVHEAEKAAQRRAEEAARRAKEVALINQIQQAVAAYLNLDDVLKSTLEQVQSVIESDATALWFVDDDNNSLMLAAAYNAHIDTEDYDGSSQTERIPLQEGMYAYLVRKNKPFLSGDILAETEETRILAQMMDEVRSMICAPLRVRERVIGVLETVHAQPNRFNQEDLTLLNAVADAVTVAIENAWLFGQLQGFNQQLEQMVQARTRELEREKEKSETILVSIADGLLVTDPDGRILRANPAMETLLDSELSELTGVSVEHPNFSSPLWKFVREISKMSEDHYTAAVDVTSPKNEKKILSFQASAAKMWDQAQKANLGTVIALRDVTALQEVDRMKANFMTGITHELKTPLAMITLHLGALIKYNDRLDEETKMDRLHRIDRATRLLGRLVDSILELSKIDSGMMQFKFESVNMVEIVTQVVQVLRPLAAKKPLELEFATNEKSVVVSADHDQLERVIMNLTENAIKYTLEGSVKVFLGKENDHAIFSVTDTGIGLTEEEIERLFERFYRADNQRNILGTGLGLSIAEEIIKEHKGEIKVTSVYGEGSTFTVTMPLQQ
ncbi:response regulator [Anaerolineales bacterium HSG25]|nr:response regulator [Anaerolineales bacterium HSG25]